MLFAAGVGGYVGHGEQQHDLLHFQQQILQQLQRQLQMQQEMHRQQHEEHRQKQQFGEVMFDNSSIWHAREHTPQAETEAQQVKI